MTSVDFGMYESTHTLTPTDVVNELTDHASAACLGDFKWVRVVRIDPFAQCAEPTGQVRNGREDLENVQ